MSLPNADINGHPLGVPAPGFHGIMQGPDQVTYRFLLDPFLVSTQSNNIEWVSGGDYDEDDLTTYGGNIYQSAVDNNVSIPGTNSDWVLLTRGASLKRYVVDGVYLEDDVIIFEEINNRLYWFMLKHDVARPFQAVDFETELLAGTWIQMGRVEVIPVVAVGADITLDMLNLAELSFNVAANITANRNILIDNDTLAETIKLFRFSANIGVELQFENKVKMHKGVSGDANWNDGTKKWISPESGLYEGWGNYSGGVWTLRIEGPF